MNDARSWSASVAEMVKLGRCPIADLQSTAAAGFARECRHRFLETGLCPLPDFVLLRARHWLAEEANAVCGHACFCKSSHKAYLTEDDPTLSTDDVAGVEQ